MKIDEGSINHNALRLIEEEVSDFCWNSTVTDDETKLKMLGYITGITDLAEALKEVLKA